MNKVVLAICIFVQHFDFNLVSDTAIKSGETLHIEKKVSILCLFLAKLRTLKWKYESLLQNMLLAELISGGG